MASPVRLKMSRGEAEDFARFLTGLRDKTARQVGQRFLDGGVRTVDILAHYRWLVKGLIHRKVGGNAEQARLAQFAVLYGLSSADNEPVNVRLAVFVTLSEEMDGRLAAEKRGTNLSAYIREALQEKLAREEARG